jgi:hypothetical protein
MNAPHYPRAAALAAGQTTYIGALCARHPEVLGLRRTSNKTCHVCAKKSGVLRVNKHRNIKGKTLTLKVQAAEASALATAVKLATEMTEMTKSRVTKKAK